MFRRRTQNLAVALFLSLSCCAVVGCSDDGGTGQDASDGGGDGLAPAHDGGADGGVRFDGGGDATTGDDASTDGSIVDSTSPTDASHADSSMNDASVDASSDATADSPIEASQPDAAMEASVDAAPDAPPPNDAGNDANGDAGITCGMPTDCPPTGNECIAATCNGMCGTMFVGIGTATPTQVAGDCKKTVCDGSGGTMPSNDDNDLPSGNDCVTPTCTSGMASTPPKTLNTACGSGGTLICDGMGACVQCVVATTCAGTDTDCHHRTCLGGSCGIANIAAGTATSTQTAGDCHTNQCDGSGNSVNNIDESDKPVDGNSCTSDVCTMGAPTNPALPGAACSQNGGSICDSAAACTTSFHVVRVGDGSAALTSVATATFLEQRFGSDGTLIVPATPLPTAVNGNNARLTLSGTATSEGALTLSGDGHYLAMAGYDAATGTASVTSSMSATVNRVAARIDAMGAIDTTTKLDALISGNNVRSAVTNDGSGFWLGGASNGVVYVPFGTTGGTAIITGAPTNVRNVDIFGGQLYGTSGSGAFVNVFTVGTGLPTTAGQTATSLTGLPTSAGPSPYAYAFLTFNAVQTLYIADDRSIASGGGVQKWTFNGTTWTLVTTFTNGIIAGVRGLAAQVVGANVVIYATTSTSSANALVRFIDDGMTLNPAATSIATAAANTVYRGVAISPH